MVEELLGSDELVSKEGRVKPKDAFDSTKIIGLLFAKTGCPFTNEMVENLIGTYKKLNIEKKVLEIVYCHAEGTQYCGTDEDDAKF